jgi:hypothetical protein
LPVPAKRPFIIPIPYRLSKLAEEDLLVIADYGDEHFGIAQSDG